MTRRSLTASPARLKNGSAAELAGAAIAATTTTTTTAAAEATTTRPTATTAAAALLTGLIDDQATALKGEAIERANCGLRGFVVTHGDETETA
jgi:hypothetical protein